MSNASLVELVAERGVKLKSWAAGHTEKSICPKCGGGKTRELSLSTTVDADGLGVVFQCHRGSCGWTDGVRQHTDDGKVLPFRREVAKPTVKPVEHAPTAQAHPGAMYAWFAKRGISRETADTFGCYFIQRNFPGLGERPALVFPYRFKGEIVNRKYRPPEKNPQLQEPDALPTLFNVDAIEAPDVVCWVEGEPDVMALHEAGYPQTVSLKDGAPAELRAEDDPRRDTDKRFLAMATHAEMLEKVEKFILAGDMDEPGMVLREELARRLGKHRCWLVTWPDGCKDANDALRQHGADRVRQCVEAAQPYPIDDVQDVTGEALDAYLQLPQPPVLSTGTAATDAILKFPGEGRLLIVSGLPNAGKSGWMIFTMVHLMRKEGRRFLVFSPEMQPWEAFATQCAQVLVGKPARRGRNVPQGTDLMTRQERIDAGNWLHGRMVFLAADSEDVVPTLDWIIERARACVLRMGVTDLVVDPWNEIAHARGAMTETDYIGRALQQLRAFANRHGCNVWIVVHPAKMQAAKAGEKIGPPGPYDIAGSANFANKADIGITIHTPEDVTQVLLWKSRFARWGRKGMMAELEYRPATGQYVSSLASQAMLDMPEPNGGESDPF